jgi:hypothetical protein
MALSAPPADPSLRGEGEQVLDIWTTPLRDGVASYPSPLATLHLFSFHLPSPLLIRPIVLPSFSHIHTLQLRLGLGTVQPFSISRCLQCLLLSALIQIYEANSSSSGCGTFEDSEMDDIEMGVAGVEGSNFLPPFPAA